MKMGIFRKNFLNLRIKKTDDFNTCLFLYDIIQFLNKLCIRLMHVELD